MGSMSVMQMLYVCVLCASCGNSQCCVLHNLQFVNAFICSLLMGARFTLVSIMLSIAVLTN